MPKRIPIWIWRHLHSPITLRVLILVAWLTIVGLLLVVHYIERQDEIQRHNEILSLMNETQKSILSTGDKMISYEGTQQRMIDVLDKMNTTLLINAKNRASEHSEIVNTLKILQQGSRKRNGRRK